MCGQEAELSQKFLDLMCLVMYVRNKNSHCVCTLYVLSAKTPQKQKKSLIENFDFLNQRLDFLMVGDRRIELLTSSVSRKRSTSELTALMFRRSARCPEPHSAIFYYFVAAMSSVYRKKNQHKNKKYGGSMWESNPPEPLRLIAVKKP